MGKNLSSEFGDFIDAEGFMPMKEGGFDFRFIMMLHIQSITKLCCTEWHGGYWNRKVKEIGGVGYPEETYIQNSRECFWNAVNCLYDLAFPHFDDEMKKEDGKIIPLLDKHEEIKGKISDEEFDSKKMILMRKLFRALSSFLKRNGYFKQKRLSE